MSKKLFKNSRKTAAVALVGIGLAGVSIASAASLIVNGSDNGLAQAGSDGLTISVCQVSEIDVYYGLDDGNGNGAGHLVTGNWDDFGYIEDYEILVLDRIDAPCAGKTFKVAVGDSLGGEIAEYEGTVPAGGGVISLDPLGWDAGPAIGNLADLAKVSVTIYDAPTP